MTRQRIAVALRRLQSILKRRPSAGAALDAAALSSWQGAGRIVTRHAGGTQMLTDLPRALGGAGEAVTPGWLLRAGLAACLASSIVLVAALEDIELTLLEVEATSRSDVRGLFGMCDAAGRVIGPGPLTLSVTVRIGARHASPARLRALVEQSRRCSPVAAALAEPVAIEMRVETRAA